MQKLNFYKNFFNVLKESIYIIAFVFPLQKLQLIDVNETV